MILCARKEGYQATQADGLRPRLNGTLCGLKERSLTREAGVGKHE